MPCLYFLLDLLVLRIESFISCNFVAFIRVNDEEKDGTAKLRMFSRAYKKYSMEGKMNKCKLVVRYKKDYDEECERLK